MTWESPELLRAGLLASDPLALVLLAVTLINLGLALVVLRATRGPREETRVFSLLALCVALWCLTNALFRLAPTVAAATLWAQLSYASALFTAATFLHFAWIYPRTAHARKGAALADKAALYGMTALLSVYAAVPGVIIQGVDLGARRILTGSGLFLFAAFMLGTSALSFALFLGHQTRLRGRARAQARYVLYGSALTAILGLVFNLLLPLLGDYRFVSLGPLGSLFFVGFSAYSIVAHHLFDVRLLIRRTLLYTLLLAALAGAFAALGKATEQLLRPLIGPDNFITQIIAALLVGFAVDPLKRALHHQVASRLFRGEEKGERGDEEQGDEALRDEALR